ncbi:MAG: hypothetical protein HDT32_02830 [Clostridiales bacterium]|nr:hypothetical protein [Clostridiales bacterium]
MNNNCTSLLLLVALLSYNNRSCCNSCGCNSCNSCDSCNSCGNNCGCGCNNNNNGTFGNAGMLCLLLAFLNGLNNNNSNS